MKEGGIVACPSLIVRKTICSIRIPFRIRTRSGMAMAIAAVIDRLKLDQVAGCVAGDDTIFVAVRMHATAEAAARAIRQKME